jgi:hypothetical protein
VICESRVDDEPLEPLDFDVEVAESARAGSVRGVLNAPVLRRCNSSNISCSSFGNLGGDGGAANDDARRCDTAPDGLLGSAGTRSLRDAIDCLILRITSDFRDYTSWV